MADTPPDALVTIPGKWDFEYRYFAGEVSSRFFNALRNEGRIYGAKCPKCARTLVPARSFCDACFVATEGWVDAGDVGVLEVFTIVTTQFPGLPAPPFAIGYVTLENADTAIVNYISGVDLSNVDVAAERFMKRPRVRAVFKPEREGRITDFQFEVLP